MGCVIRGAVAVPPPTPPTGIMVRVFDKVSNGNMEVSFIAHVQWRISPNEYTN
jgi:hypothetical protein